MTEDAPPVRPEALRDEARTLAVAAVGGTIAFAGLIAVCQILAFVQSLLVGVFGLWSWAKIGLLTAVLSLRAEVEVRLAGAAGVGAGQTGAISQWRLVPMVLTLFFLWLAARAGRRAARARPGRSALVTSTLAAAGAAIPVAAFAALVASLVKLSFPGLAPGLGLILKVDVIATALWGGGLAGAAAGIGAYLESAGEGLSPAALRGALVAYGWALGLVAVGVLVVATLEPTVTRAYVDGLGQFGVGGAVLAGYHILAIPTQSALMLVPATTSCLDLLVEGRSALSLCPWGMTALGRVGHALFLGQTAPLSPWLWLLNAVPLVAAGLGGWKAASGSGGRVAIARGMAAGAAFACFVVAGALFAALRFSVPASVGWVPFATYPRMPETAATAFVWGIVGGALGGWLAGRRYEEPGLPSPTSV